jgi:hypothetical protein
MEHPQVKTSYPIPGTIVQILNEAPWHEDVQGSTVTADITLTLAVQQR